MIQIDDLRMRKHDALNWAIEQRHITLKGATAWSNIGYYPSLEIAARNLFIKAISEKDSIAELIQTIENAKKRHNKRLSRAIGPDLIKNNPIRDG